MTNDATLWSLSPLFYNLRKRALGVSWSMCQRTKRSTQILQLIRLSGVYDPAPTPFNTGVENQAINTIIPIWDDL